MDPVGHRLDAFGLALGELVIDAQVFELGVTGPFMNAGFVLSGLLLLAGVVGIAASIPELGPRARWGSGALLALSPLGCMADGVFTLESFFPHFIGYLFGIGGTVVSFLVFGLVIRRLPRWRCIGNTLLVASPLTLVLLIVAQATFDPIAAGANIGVAGLTERIVVTEVFLRFVALGWVARRSSGVAQPAVLPAAA